MEKIQGEQPTVSSSNADAAEIEDGALLENEVESPSEDYLEKLCILPPSCADSDTSEGGKGRKQLVKDAILLPPILATEPVSAIRGAISEIRGYAHITSYRLVLEHINDEQLVDDIVQDTKRRMGVGAGSENGSVAHSNGNHAGGKKNKKKKQNSIAAPTVVSPYTCDQSAVGTSSFSAESKSDDTEEDEIILNDYDDLTLLSESGTLSSGMGLRMVLEQYNLGSAKDHVNKTKYLLDGNAPAVLGVLGAVPPDSDSKDESSVQKKDLEQENGGDKEETQKDESVDKNTKEAEKKKLEIDPAELKIPVFPAANVPLSTSLQDFYYLSCGEEERLAIANGEKFENQSLEVNDKDAELGSGNSKNISSSASAPAAHAISKRFAELEEKCKVDCSIAFGGFNPPPPHRALLGDLAYLEVSLPGGEGTVYITVIPTGFYINRSAASSDNGSGSKTVSFDPSPASQPCFSQTLLDCLLLKSPALRVAWSEALVASLERSELTAKNNDPLQTLFRAATHVDIADKKMSVDEMNSMFDSATLKPSWLVPLPRSAGGKGSKVSQTHEHNPMRSEEEFGQNFGVDFRNGAARDWNEELQLAREMPRDTIDGRIERARLVHKTLCDFGDAAAAGVAGIFKGQIGPMNPNEDTRSHVYLHNNIFFSRAMDSGIDTFKIARGDKCARKSVSRDAGCVGMLHKLDYPGINTLATVLIDYLGTRMVCQSIVPGILLGEKTHKILYGAVEAASPLAWDKEFHEKLKGNLGKDLMIASREVPKLPLSDEKMAEIEREQDYVSNSVEEKSAEATSSINFFGSVELKGIRGSDCRDYCLDITRLTPRDANWVSKKNGGTGKWEERSSDVVANLDDDEWIVSVLRQELIRRFTSMKMQKFFQARKDKKGDEKDATKEESDADKEKSAKEESDYLETFRVNLNVFLPHFRKFEDEEASKQLKKDEDLAREIATYLWEIVLPQITKDVRENQGQIPVDGKSLTNYLHDKGVNCRYLGQLARLAIEEEGVDAKEEQDLIDGKVKTIRRRSMPLCWLEMLECEMVARAAKHVLDGYLAENGGSVASQPSKTVAAFLSALMCSSEESAADTEKRLNKQGTDSDDVAQTTLFNTSVRSLPMRGRDDIWQDIEKEVGRRFVYKLHLFNKTNAKDPSRISLKSLLRRVCQRSGIRLYAKDYNIGGKGLTSTNSSYPIDSEDIAAILPTLKHAANDGRQGFVPCRNGADAANAYLHVLLDDARNTYDAAHMLLNEKNFSLALEYSQEATNLYQRVTETPLSAKVLQCLDLTTLILFQAQEVEMSVSHAGKALAISMQIGGFDSSEVVSSHQTLAHLLLTSGRLTSSIKHMRAVLYLLELLGGPHHVELSTLYQKIGSIYDEVGNVAGANHFFQAAIRRKSNDRVLSGILTKQLASVYAKIGQLPGAVAMERQTYNIFSMTLGEDHEYSKSSKQSLEQYIKVATERGKIFAEQEKKLREEAAANKIADEIVANEIAEEKKKKKKKSKSKSKKKK